MNASNKPGAQRRAISLLAPGWTPATRTGLERLIRSGSGRGLPVVFDFDNTIVSGDIGEAVLAHFVQTGRLKSANISPSLAPSFRLPDGESVTLKGCIDATEYYEQLLAPTALGAHDPTPHANGYVWAVEALEGLTPWEIVKATRSVFMAGTPGKRTLIEATPGATAYPAPFFYPEMVELIAELLRHSFDFWIVSASNTWSVRWMVLEGLNPLLRARGLAVGVPSDRIVGVSTLLLDKAGRLHKDPLLAGAIPGYASLDPKELKRFHLTSRLHFPVPTYSGKVACIFDSIGSAPYFCAGDSPGDLPMLSFSKHRLWMARLEKPDYQKTRGALPHAVLNRGWLIQPTQAGATPGLVSKAECRA